MALPPSEMDTLCEQGCIYLYIYIYIYIYIYVCVCVRDALIKMS